MTSPLDLTAPYIPHLHDLAPASTTSVLWCWVMSDQVGEVGDARKRLVDGELERDGGEQENERQLKAVLRLLEVDGESCERHAADEELHSIVQHSHVKHRSRPVNAKFHGSSFLVTSS